MPTLESLCGVNAYFSVPAAIEATEDNSTLGPVGLPVALTYPPIPDHRYRLGSVAVSFNKNPQAGADVILSVKMGARVVYRVYLGNAGPHFFPFVPPIVSLPGESLEVAVSDPGGSAIAALNAHVWRFFASTPY